MENLIKKSKDELKQTRKILAARNFQAACETAPRLSELSKVPLTEESVRRSFSFGYNAAIEKISMELGIDLSRFRQTP